MEKVVIRPQFTDDQINEAVLEVMEDFIARKTVTIFCAFTRSQLASMDELGPPTIQRFLSALGAYKLMTEIKKTGRRYCVSVQMA